MSEEKCDIKDLKTPNELQVGLNQASDYITKIK
jgi:hypothetical protein